MNTQASPDILALFKWKQVYHKSKSPKSKEATDAQMSLWCRPSCQTKLLDNWQFLNVRNQPHGQTREMHSQVNAKLQLESLTRGQTGEDF